MIWAYVLENQGVDDKRSNQPVFQMIRHLDIMEDYIIFDESDKRDCLYELLDTIDVGDKLIIRSAEDLADNLSDLVDVFNILTKKKITLCSCKETFLCGEEYLTNLNGFVDLYLYYYKKNKESGYKKAVAEGRVGRPAKKQEIEQAISMYQSGLFKMAQIETITGISKSTIYRNMKID